jgi:NTE family protein
MALAAAIKSTFRCPQQREKSGISVNERVWRASLALVETFQDLPIAQLAALETHLVTVPVCRGEVLVRAGDEADALYLVVSGRFSVEAGGRRVAEVSSGPIGEVAFFANGTRTATVRALRDSIVLKLPRADFTALCEDNPTILRGIATTLARRLSDTLAEAARSTPHPRTLAVIGAGHEPLPDEFRSKLTAAFARSSNILAIDAKGLAQIFPDQSEYDFETVTGWLNEQEARYEYVLYFADSGLTPFSRKAIRQADHVLLVARHKAHTDPTCLRPSAVETFASEIHPNSGFTLVLLHDTHVTISSTSSWLKSRPIALHHHVVTGNEADYDRLVRFIGGNAVGFVACGGGALCAAHVGVYKALTGAGVRFDLLGGTSGGGAMTAAFAMGASADDVSRRTADLFAMARALRRWTWPRYSLLDHTVIDRALKLHYGDTQIEDLWTGYFAVSTCLANNALSVINRGPVWKAVRATSSIPASFLPFITRTDVCWSMVPCSTTSRSNPCAP